MTSLQFLTGMIWLSQFSTIHGRRWFKISLSILGKWPVLTSRTIIIWMRWWIQENMNQTFLNIFTWCSMCSGQYTYTLQQTVIKSSSTIFFQESNVYKSDEEYHKHRKHKGGSHKMISMLQNLTIINSLTMSLFKNSLVRPMCPSVHWITMFPATVSMASVSTSLSMTRWQSGNTTGQLVIMS